MKSAKNRIGLVCALMAATALTVPVAAQDDDKAAALEKRVAELEAMVKMLVSKLDTQEVAISDQRDRLYKAEPIIAKAAEVAEAADSRPKDGFMVGNTHVTYGGYLKVDGIATKNSDGPPAGTASIVRDFYIPSTVPVGGEASDMVFEISPRQTRFFTRTSTKVGGETVGTYLEFDFMVTANGDERISNSWEPRMRHAWITYKNWLIGQAWSTFMDVGALPDSVDFIGTTEGTAFNRQPLIRYTNGGFQLALEQPEVTLTNQTGGRVLSGSDPLPDLVLRYNHKGDWGHMTFAAIGRNLNAEGGTAGLTGDGDSAFGYGATVAGKLKVGAKDDFRWSVSAGEGLGRYVGLNTVNAAAVDLTNNSLETIGLVAGFGAYRHVWNEKARSTLMFSYFKADNPTEFTSAAPTDEVWSVRGNVIFSPVPRLDFGIEYGYSQRTLESGIDGSQHRLQFSSKFSF